MFISLSIYMYYMREGTPSYSSLYPSQQWADPWTSMQFDNKPNTWQKTRLFLTCLFPYFCFWLFFYSKMWRKRIRWTPIYIGFHFFYIFPLVQTRKGPKCCPISSGCWRYAEALCPTHWDQVSGSLSRSQKVSGNYSLPTGEFISLRNTY